MKTRFPCELMQTSPQAEEAVTGVLNGKSAASVFRSPTSCQPAEPLQLQSVTLQDRQGPAAALCLKEYSSERSA